MTVQPYTSARRRAPLALDTLLGFPGRCVRSIGMLVMEIFVYLTLELAIVIGSRSGNPLHGWLHMLIAAAIIGGALCLALVIGVLLLLG